MAREAEERGKDQQLEAECGHEECYHHPTQGALALMTMICVCVNTIHVTYSNAIILCM